MKYLKYLISMPFTGVLLLVFATAIGVATFIENDFGPTGSQAVVYKALWFEILLLLLVVNMIGVIFLHKLYAREKWPNLTFHVAFIVILIGAGITRFFGIEGIMHIREGETANSFVSDETYISSTILAGEDKESFQKKVLFSPIKRSKFSKTVTAGGRKVHYQLKSYIHNATQIVENDPEHGVPVITVVTAGRNGRENKYLTRGNTINVMGIQIGFDVEDETAVRFTLDQDGGLMFKSPKLVKTLSMDTQAEGTIPADSMITAPFRHLLTIEAVNFVIASFNPTGTVKIVSAPAEQGTVTLDAVVMGVESGENYEEIVLFGGKGQVGRAQFIQLGNLNLSLSYGALRMDVPFAVQLRDFELERYPGSESPSSYASEVTVLDGETHFPFRIYMNNILSYKGYRFYQSSYDKDEGGTVLSVNRDKPGTYVTYFGYFMLAVGLIWVFFAKDTRFAQLSHKIDAIHAKREKLTGILVGLLMLSSFTSVAQSPLVAPIEQANEFGTLVYQTNDGRMAPLNTLASDLLRKIYKQTTFDSLSAEQVMLGMMSDPMAWQQVKMITVKEKEVKALLDLSDEKYVSFADFFNDRGAYKLKAEVNAAYNKKPGQRSILDKELLKVDERVNVCYLIYQGYLLKIFPVPNDTTHHHWVTPVDEDLHGMTGNDSSFVRNAALEYLRSIKENNLEQADYILDGIKLYQNKYGAAVMPGEGKLNLEIKFNSWDIFKRLYSYYMLIGFVLFILLFIKILNPRAQLKYLVGATVILILIGFIIHTAGLALRWYLSGHAPWSNGYESMIYIAWTVLLAGFAFRRKSIMTLSVTAILGGIVLWVANMSWMDPEITNLVPVLKSYWLTIHVATIVASYGFLGLGALLAFANLLTMILQKEKNKLRLGLSIKELTYVIEMSLIVGIVLLTIGNFLGGIWANESWGRYWGWDPKETWAMATIIFYAFVLHMRLIPGLQSTFTFNFAALIAYASVLMTYFGVNFYLSGLHSYAAGDPVPIPTFVYYAVAIIAVVSVAAYYNINRLKTQQAVNAVEQAEEDI
jgi:cytochrome c-type biogenesis protein CcsB